MHILAVFIYMLEEGVRITAKLFFDKDLELQVLSRIVLTSIWIFILALIFDIVT